VRDPPPAGEGEIGDLILTTRSASEFYPWRGANWQSPLRYPPLATCFCLPSKRREAERRQTLIRNRENLWGDAEQISFKQSTVDSVTRFMIKRMKSTFKGIVLDEWLPLGRGGSHWYSLLFACANPSVKATEIAERLARAVMVRK
jgi:hypothetical protein